MECPAHLIYVSDTMPGYSRRKQGKGFVYLNEQNRKITDPETLERIKRLVIPPMWEQVWICTMADGHLQATGQDQKRRKQYLYHPDWVEFRQQSKFAKMIQFGRALPGIRRRVIQDFKTEGWPKQKVLALIVKLLDELHIRVGNECYRDSNDTFGLTTLRRKHLKEDHGQLRLEYKGKSGRYRKVTIRNKSLVRMIRETADLPGYEIFRYMEDGISKPVDSRDVNNYIHTIAGQPFSAKDFRTWGGTVLAIERYPDAVREISENPRRKFETAIVRAVANELGNTLSVCREYYIHPRVLEVLVQGELESFHNLEPPDLPGKSQLRRSELTALNILQAPHSETSASSTQAPDGHSPAPLPRKSGQLAACAASSG